MQNKIEVNVTELESAAGQIKIEAEEIKREKEALLQGLNTLQKAWQSESGRMYADTLEQSVNRLNRLSDSMGQLADKMLKTAEDIRVNEIHLQEMFQIESK